MIAREFRRRHRDAVRVLTKGCADLLRAPLVMLCTQSALVGLDHAVSRSFVPVVAARFADSLCACAARRLR